MVVPELAATLVEDDGDVALVDEEGDVLLRLELLVSSFATEVEDVPTVLDGVAVVPFVSLAFELSVELDFGVSLAATEDDVSDFDRSDLELSEVVDDVLELGEVALATEELLVGEVAAVLLLGEVVLFWSEAVRLESDV